MTTHEQGDPLAPSVKWGSTGAVWVATVVGAVLIGIFTGRDDYLVWLGLAMAGATLVAMCVQLATQEKNGFVVRLGLSAGGSFLILAVATAVLAIVHA